MTQPPLARASYSAVRYGAIVVLKATYDRPTPRAQPDFFMLDIEVFPPAYGFGIHLADGIDIQKIAQSR